MSHEHTPLDLDPTLKKFAEEIASAMVDELWSRMRRGDVVIAPEYLSPRQVTQLTGVPVKTLEAFRGVRKGPRYYRVGGRVRYKLADVRAWIEANGPVE